MDGQSYKVIGVMPRGFRYDGEPIAGTATEIEVYAPMAANPLTVRARTLRSLKVVGRLKPGVTAAQARDEVRRLGTALAEQFPESDRGLTYDAQPLAAQVTRQMRGSMILLLATVGFVLLMACANVANLLLARAAARQREISVRVAIGAPQWRLMRQLLIEGLTLAAAGGAAGLVLAAGVVRVLVAVGPESLMRVRPVAIDGRALAVTSAAVICARCWRRSLRHGGWRGRRSGSRCGRQRDRWRAEAGCGPGWWCCR